MKIACNPSAMQHEYMASLCAGLLLTSCRAHSRPDAVRARADYDKASCKVVCKKCPQPFQPQAALGPVGPPAQPSPVLEMLLVNCGIVEKENDFRPGEFEDITHVSGSTGLVCLA